MSRHNLCPNPAAKNNATGYLGGATLARTTDFPTPACPRATGVRATGSGFLQTPAAACAPGDVFTASFYGHNGTASDFDFGHTVYVAYTRSSGGDTFPQTQSFATGAVGTTGRFSITASAAPALATGIYLLWDSLITGYGFTGVLLEKVGALDTYADGDTSGWSWDGTNGNSTSSETSTTPVGRTLSAVWNVRGAVGRALDTPWNVRGAVGRSLSTPWTVRGSVGRSLDAEWAQRGSVGRTLNTPWNIRGVTGRTLDVPWALRGQISRTLGTTWTVRAKVTSNLQVLWVVNGAPPSTARLPSVGAADLTGHVTSYPDEVTAYL